MQQENIPIKVGLLELLYGSQGTQFVIPAYQRNYTWVANREVKQLLDDKSSFYPKRVNATALSTSAAIILHGSRNGWEYWMNEDGVQLDQVEGLRKNNE